MVHFQIMNTLTLTFAITDLQLIGNPAVIYFYKVLLTAHSLTTVEAAYIVAIESVVTLHGHVQFTHNTAHSGAALPLDCPKNSSDKVLPSFLILTNATVIITNQIALNYGGGIAVNPVCDYTGSCFFKASKNTLAFLDNRALIAANSVYGPSTDICSILDEIDRSNLVHSQLFLI